MTTETTMTTETALRIRIVATGNAFATTRDRYIKAMSGRRYDPETKTWVLPGKTTDDYNIRKLLRLGYIEIVEEA